MCHQAGRKRPTRPAARISSRLRSWLLDVLPTEYRQYEVLRRHPAALALMAGYYADSCVEGPRRDTAPAAASWPSWCRRMSLQAADCRQGGRAP